MSSRQKRKQQKRRRLEFKRLKEERKRDAIINALANLGPKPKPTPSFSVALDKEVERVLRALAHEYRDELLYGGPCERCRSKEGATSWKSTTTGTRRSSS